MNKSKMIHEIDEIFKELAKKHGLYDWGGYIRGEFIQNIAQKLEPYILVDGEGLRRKLSVYERMDGSGNALIDENYSTYSTMLKMLLRVDKKELQDNPDMKEYAKNYLIDAFIHSLEEPDMIESETNVELMNAQSDYYKMMTLMKERGIDSYDKMKEVFNKVDKYDKYEARGAYWRFK